MRPDRELGKEAMDLANDISRLCEGHSTVAVYMALSMMLGGSAARAPRPDFEGMMTLVERAAFDEFCRSRPEDRP